ncbi:protodermal factor 1 [Phtheirospermum japonicum]|uniref:Protodermal factor 1 n=1 Tax=Phtheirospermum japonicum TaxID=374723 RepID=A0A830BTY5_9LAMI|nr:protodermal factor 1 [Phtheirospermum japonicum]
MVATPPANCGTPPSGGGGGHHHHTPSPPSGGRRLLPFPTHRNPYYTHPPTPLVASPPPIVTPPVIITPPTTPIDPGTPSTPGITIPSPPFPFPSPFPFDPNSPPFTCTYWRNHPTLIWGLFGWWGTTVGSAFGVTSLPGTGANMNVLQALSNTRLDGLGQLYREGTAALLNSIAHTRFPYTTSQVRDSFVSALGSNKAAADQAQLFRLANEGKTKPRA